MNYNGLLLTIRKPEEGDLETITQWLADPLFLSTFYGSPLDTYQTRLSQVKEFLNQNAKDFSSNVTLIAIDKKSDEPVGLIMFNNINWKHRHAEVSMVIGAEKFRGSYYGVDIHLMGLVYAFYELNLHKVFGYAYESKVEDLKLHDFGGKVNGVLRKHVYRNGKFLNLVAHSVTETEFKTFVGSQKKKLLKNHMKKGVLEVFQTVA